MQTNYIRIHKTEIKHVTMHLNELRLGFIFNQFDVAGFKN